MNASTRVVINTLAQYVRTIFMVVIVLYTSRVVLDNLGVNDYGIYSLVSGVVAMLAFIRNNLSKTIQRFLSYHHGSGNKEMVVKIFNNSVCTQLIITIILCGVLLACTPLIFNYLLKIPIDRLVTAKTVYVLMVFSLFFQMLTAPYEAVLIARENIIFSSIVSVVDAVLKIPIALSLIYISSDKLEWYSVMMALVVVLNYFVFRYYCKRKYDECLYFSLRSFNKELFKEMFSFMGWNVYGTMCVTGRTQGVAILLNRFFSTAINAAFGLGGQVAGQVSFLSGAITTAINPQIIKAEGGGDRGKMFRLSEISCKFSFLLMSMVAIPAVIYMDFIMDIWLKEVPPYTCMFCQMIILTALVDLTTLNMNTTNQAVGNVKFYQICINSIKICSLPVTWLVLRMGQGPFEVMVVYIVFELLCAISRIVFLHISVQLPVLQFVRNVILGILPVFFINLIVCYFVSRYLTGWWLIVTGILSIVTTCCSAWLIGLQNDEKDVFRKMITKIKTRIN